MNEDLDNMLLGSKVVGSTLGALTQCVALAAAFACSTFWGGVAMYIMAIIVGFLVSMLAVTGLAAFAPGALVSVGKGASFVKGKFMSMFSKAEPVAA